LINKFAYKLYSDKTSLKLKHGSKYIDQYSALHDNSLVALWVFVHLIVAHGICAKDGNDRHNSWRCKYIWRCLFNDLKYVKQIV